MENNTQYNDGTTELKGTLEGMPPSDTIVIYPNPEKKGAVRLGREEYMPLVTSRMLFSGPPGSGKRNIILNIIRRIVPRPSKCYVVHHDPDTTEYDILGDWGIDTDIFDPNAIPNLATIDKDNREAAEESNDEDSEGESSEEAKPAKKILSNPLIIIDEVTSQMLDKTNLSRFERMVNHMCTHRNTTLMCSIQSAANIPPMIRRGFNHFALWKQADENLNKLMARRTGVTTEELNVLFGLLRDPHEFIWIDLDSPIDSDWRYRLNFMSPIYAFPRQPGDDSD